MKVKYPRTYHLPFSKGSTSDDKTLSIPEIAASALGKSQDVVVTLKMDGENTTMYRDTLHARSLDSKHHPSRDWVKQLHGQICHLIPDGWRICGENLYARHSIEYTDLASYFYVFSIWDDTNTCLSWDATKEWCELLGLSMVEVVYRGPYEIGCLQQLAAEFEGVAHTHEGFVVRIAEPFKYDDFGQCVAKYVRENHVQADTHWMHAQVVPNTLRSTGTE